MPREGHGSRNFYWHLFDCRKISSCPARGMGVEISEGLRGMISGINVMPREGHGSRNFAIPVFELGPA